MRDVGILILNRTDNLHLDIVRTNIPSPVMARFKRAIRAGKRGAIIGFKRLPDAGGPLEAGHDEFMCDDQS